MPSEFAGEPRSRPRLLGAGRGIPGRLRGRLFKGLLMALNELNKSLPGARARALLARFNRRGACYLHSAHPSGASPPHLRLDIVHESLPEAEHTFSVDSASR